jgi:hypothetical protein
MKGSGSLVAAGVHFQTKTNPAQKYFVLHFSYHARLNLLPLLSASPSELPAELKFRPSDGKIVDTCDLSLEALTALRLYGPSACTPP